MRWSIPFGWHSRAGSPISTLPITCACEIIFLANQPTYLHHLEPDPERCRCSSSSFLSPPSLTSLTSFLAFLQGYRTLLSSPWYLNLGGFASNDWTKYYSVEPQDFDGSQEQHDLVMGGEVNFQKLKIQALFLLRCLPSCTLSISRDGIICSISHIALKRDVSCDDCRYLGPQTWRAWQIIGIPSSQSSNLPRVK